FPPRAKKSREACGLPALCRTSRQRLRCPGEGDDIGLRTLTDLIQIERIAGVDAVQIGRIAAEELLRDAQDAVAVVGRGGIRNAADTSLAGERPRDKGAEDRPLAAVVRRVVVSERTIPVLVDRAELKLVEAAQAAAGREALLELVEDEELNGGIEQEVLM